MATPTAGRHRIKDANSDGALSVDADSEIGDLARLAPAQVLRVGPPGPYSIMRTIPRVRRSTTTFRLLMMS